MSKNDPTFKNLESICKKCDRKIPIGAFCIICALSKLIQNNIEVDVN